jgi:hypothetical protein
MALYKNIKPFSEKINIKDDCALECEVAAPSYGTSKH